MIRDIINHIMFHINIKIMKTEDFQKRWKTRQSINKNQSYKHFMRMIMIKGLLMIINYRAVSFENF